MSRCLNKIHQLVQTHLYFPHKLVVLNYLFEFPNTLFFSPGLLNIFIFRGNIPERDIFLVLLPIIGDGTYDDELKRLITIVHSSGCVTCFFHQLQITAIRCSIILHYFLHVGSTVLLPKTQIGIKYSTTIESFKDFNFYRLRQTTFVKLKVQSKNGHG